MRRNDNMTFAPPLMSQIALFPVSKPHSHSVRRENGEITMTMTPKNRNRWIYGKTPRILFLYVQSLLAKSNSPDVDRSKREVTFHGNFHSFCVKTGLTQRGGTREQVESMLEDLAGTSVSIVRKCDDVADGEPTRVQMSCTIADRVETEFKGEPDTFARIRFSEPMWNELVRSSIPLNTEIIAALGKSARAIDIYLWLAYRTNGLAPGVELHLTWGQLFDQFEGTDMEMWRFKQKFRQAFDKVKRAWPAVAARLDDDGLSCRKSPSSLMDGRGDDDGQA